MAAPLSVIILALNEEANLPACLTSLAGLDAKVFVVDSGSTDRTREIAEAEGATVLHHEWDNYSTQRNWAFENCDIEGDWVLSLDADERLTPECVQAIRDVIADDDTSVDGYMLRKRTYFMGRWIRHGGHYPSYHLRLARRGRVRCEDRLYDQHFVVDGAAKVLPADYIDILTNSLTDWTNRHNRWATLEAQEILSSARGPGKIEGRLGTGDPIRTRRWLREGFYQRFPLFVRPVLYFCYRYFIRLGFLDGREGLVFHVLQGFWFRFLVDAKIHEMRKAGRKA